MTRTLAQAMTLGVIRAITGTLVAATLLVAAPMLTGLVDETRPGEARPLAAGSPSAVMAEAEAEGVECWQGEAPDDVDVPGSVVWQYVDGRTVRSARLVQPALEKLFGAGNLPGRPVAFCR